jgi:hypothetical protein
MISARKEGEEMTSTSTSRSFPNYGKLAQLLLREKSKAIESSGSLSSAFFVLNSRKTFFDEDKVVPITF